MLGTPETRIPKKVKNLMYASNQYADQRIQE